jgi:integrase
MASIRKLRDGVYQLLWRDPISDEYGRPTGRKRQTSEVISRDNDRDALKAAQRRRVAIEASLETGHSPSDTRAERTLGEYAADYFDSLTGSLKDQTIEGYRKLYRVHLAPELGNRPIASIQVSDVTRLRAKLPTSQPHRREANRNPKTVKQALGVEASRRSLA